MLLRSFRTILLLTCLLCLYGCSSGVVATQTTTPGAHAGRGFQPSGNGVALPQVIHTDSLSYVTGTNLDSTRLPPSGASTPTSALASHPQLISQTLVDVPPPGSVDPSAMLGMSQPGGKPDANGAGGLSNYLEATNPGIAIFSRDGTPLMRGTYRSWFRVNSPFYDPVVMWDDTGARFIFSVLRLSAKQIWLSVAQQSDAMGTYCNYSFPAPAGHDFDKLGVDGDGVYFSFNVLAPGTNNVVSNELFFANRMELENCQAASYTDWMGLTNPDGTIAQAITPARQDSRAGGVEYLVNSIPAGACKLTLWTLTSSGTLINTSVPTQCYSPPPNARQKGSAALIDTGDCSITQVSYVNGLLTVDTPGTHDWGDGNGPVGIVEWYVLNPSKASIASQGAFGTPGYWLFYPSTIMTPNGHMLFVYNASGPSIYPSVWYVNQGMRSATALVTGTGYYGTRGVSPWGDYQSAWPDASGGSPNSVWITGEFARVTHAWGSRFDLVTP